MGNSTPQDSPQDRANEARSSHPERTGSSAANLPDNDFLETEEELDLDDIDWSMLTDLSTKISPGLDTSTEKQSDAATDSSPLDLDLPNWSEEVNETEASLAEMLDLESLDDFDSELGDLEEELGLGTVNDDFFNQAASVNDFDSDPFDDREFNRDRQQNVSGSTEDDWGFLNENDRELVDMADATVINANAEIPIPSSNEFELADLYDPDEFGEFAEFGQETPITTEIPSDEGVSWNLTDRDLQEFTNPANTINDGDDEPSWGNNEEYAKSIEDDEAQLGSDRDNSFGANTADVPDYYADEVDSGVLKRNDLQTPSQNLVSGLDGDTSGGIFAELSAPQEIPDLRSAPSSDRAPATSDWEFPNVPDLEISTPEINHDFSDLDAADEEFSDSTRIEDGGNRSREGGDLSSERYSAAWEQELSSSYYSETPEQEQAESFDLVTDEDWDPTDRHESPPETPQVLPPLPSLPPLPPLPSLPPLNSPRSSQPSSSNASHQGRIETKSQRGFEQFDLPELEWEETVSPRLGGETKLRKDRSSDLPPIPKSGPLPGTTEYKQVLSENLSSDMSWSEILDMQPDISAEPLNIPDIPARKPTDPPNQASRSNFAPPDIQQGRSPTQNLPNNIPVDRIEQMGAFSDSGNTDFNTPGFAGMPESMGDDDPMPRDRIKPSRPSINIPNIPELWDRYGEKLKIPAIALGAIAAVFGFFSIPPIKRFTVETGLRIGFNKDASGQDLTGINFKGGNLEKVNFTNANLTNANLESVNLKGTTLIGTKLDGANLQKADLKGARLVNASLVQANLANATLNLADLSDANLAKANLSKANLNGALLKGSKIESSTKIDPEDLLMWQIVNEPRANRNLAGINMTGFNLSSASLQGAKLTDAKLTWSDLSNSDLSNAKLDRTDMSGANLQGANLKGANLAQATWAKDRAPKTDNQTICPNGAQGPCKL